MFVSGKSKFGGFARNAQGSFKSKKLFLCGIKLPYNVKKGVKNTASFCEKVKPICNIL